MKRAVVTAVVLCAVATLGGCPLYNHGDNACFRDSECYPGYVCDGRSGACVLPSGCGRPSDCGVNQTCDRTGQCVSGDCSFNGCVNGYSCDSSSGIWACVSNSVGAGGAGGSGTGDGGAAGSDTAAAGSAAGEQEVPVTNGEAGQAGSGGAPG